jgi:hypothetical protein
MLEVVCRSPRERLCVTTAIRRALQHLLHETKPGNAASGQAQNLTLRI